MKKFSMLEHLLKIALIRYFASFYWKFRLILFLIVFLQQPPRLKKARFEILSKLNEGNCEILSANPNNIDEEIFQYLSVTVNFPLHSDLTFFWQNNKQKFPILYELSKIIFSISPTSASAERVFSIMGALLNQRRANMNPVKARKVMFIHDNSELLGQ